MILPRVNAFSIVALAMTSSSLISASTSTYQNQNCSNVHVIPASVVNAPSIVNTVSSACGLDGPKVAPINASTYDWWYFEVVSEDQSYYASISFLATPGTGFTPSLFPNDAILATYISVASPEFAHYGLLLPAERAVITTDEGQGASGVWEGAGTSFTGTADLSSYRVDLDVPGGELSGWITLDSIAPAHYPSGPAQAGESMETIVGWANAIPDSVAEVYFNINGTEVKFTGSGYHDKNWGSKPFNETVASWYWGRGRLGPYSVVWFDGLDTEGIEHVAVYVAKDGAIVYSAKSGIVVRPTGSNAEYPPHKGDMPGGLHAVIDMGEAGVLEFDVIHTVDPILEEENHAKWRGILSGGLRGQEQILNGTASYEQFALVEA